MKLPLCFRKIQGLSNLIFANEYTYLLHPSSTENSSIHLIDRQDKLLQCLGQLARWSSLGIDIEFDNNSYGYGVTLCLIQVATEKACYVIDPLSGLDLSGLYALFESPGIRKIMHASGEDLRLLHSLGCFPKNLFDTEVAARLLNYEPTSLAVLLRDKLSVALDKKQQRSNWLRRPLSPLQVQYAAEDVIWLHQLKALLEAEAAERSLLPFLLEEQELLGATRYPVAPKANFLKPADLYNLSPREQYITNELLRYRDGLAQSINRPVYQVMDDELVRRLAAGNIQPESIVDVQGVPPRFKNSRFAARLSEQLEKAKKEAAAQNLSAKKVGRPKPTQAEHTAIQKAATDRTVVFAPIQEALRQRFGTHAAKFMLSNTVVGSLLKGAITLDDIKPGYRQRLIRSIADAAGIDLKGYEREGT